jgi:hypothetical protein
MGPYFFNNKKNLFFFSPCLAGEGRCVLLHVFLWEGGVHF